MPCTPEQRTANRRNATRSTGPKTEEGKARSRANSLKHGLTGEGIVIPEEDQAESDRRADEFEAEFRPESLAGRYLIRRAAQLSVRLDRSVKQENAAIARNVRDAPRVFDEERRAEVDRLMKAMVEDPSGSTRLLRQSPEGIDAMVASLTELRANLVGTGPLTWEGSQGGRLRQLFGKASIFGDRSRLALLINSSVGNYSFQTPEDAAGRTDPERRQSAKEQLVALIDIELEELRNLRAGLDHQSIALDRLEASDRALFDPSKTAQLARKYEAANERLFFRTLKEYREVEAQVAEADAKAEYDESSEELASSFRADPVASLENPGPRFTIPNEPVPARKTVGPMVRELISGPTG